MHNLLVSLIIRPRVLGCAAALVLPLGGCGGGQHTHTATTARAGAGQAPTIRFTGGSLPGTVYVGVGPASNSLDAYRLSGPLPNAKRLTYSPHLFGINGRTYLGINGHSTVANGISGLTANRRNVLIWRVCCDNLNFMELLNPARHGGLPGTVVAIGAATAIALAPDGHLAEVVPDYRGCRCDALLVRPSLFGRDRVVYRVPHPRGITAADWSASNRLAILVGTPKASGEATYSAEIVLGPGTPAQRTIEAEGPVDSFDGIWWGPRGELSYLLFSSFRAVVRFPTGQTRSFVLPDTTPTCWLPNDTIFTLGNKETLGTLNPHSGAITTIGHYPSSIGDIFVLDCPH